MELVVGRIGRAHGVRGEVSVDVRTDDAERRFAPGSVLGRRDLPPLTVERSRWHSGRMLVAFEGFADRSAAESLRGQLLVVDSATTGDTEPGEWWDHELVGLRVELADHSHVGEIAEVVHLPGNDLLVVHDDAGREVLVPFVKAIVPVVDVESGRVVVDPPEGLLGLATDAPQSGDAAAAR